MVQQIYTDITGDNETSVRQIIVEQMKFLNRTEIGVHLICLSIIQEYLLYLQ